MHYSGFYHHIKPLSFYPVFCNVSLLHKMSRVELPIFLGPIFESDKRKKITTFVRPNLYISMAFVIIFLPYLKIEILEG